jgi:tRNA (guanine-N7-)-methyltransferase
VKHSNTPASELIPPSYFEPLQIERAFMRPADLEVDIGCGEGAFLVAMAARFPERNFLGVERLLGRIRKTCRRAAALNLENVRVLRLESFYTVRHLLPPGSVSVFHVMFPDPWPKRKHQRRRLVNDPFLDAIHAALSKDGELRLTTDDADYFAHMRRVGLARTDFETVPWPDDPGYPQTDFERGFRARGLPIHRLLLRKI